MFTGIVSHVGEITRVEKSDQHMTLWINTQFTDLQLGESIAVDGICLTVIAFTEQRFCCELSIETLQCTVAAAYALGQRVNLERALRMQDRLGGHWVLGHVDQPVRVKHIEQVDGFFQLEFDQVAAKSVVYVSPKGCITINGVSLTVNACSAGGFSVMLIPHTLSSTTLGDLVVGSLVNIEFDHIAKLVQQQLQHTHNNTVEV